jgi:5-methylcytosine-specific restriction endonuclease McrA
MAMESLVLNNGGIPVSIVPCMRAVRLVLAEKAIALENYPNALIHSAKIIMPMPSVIQCMHSTYVPRKYVNILPFSRKNVYIRDKGVCQYCGKKVGISQFTFDHVVPRCHGGTSCWENVVISCIKCNGAKGNKSVSKFKKPIVQPYAPRLTKAAPAYLASKLATEIPIKSWEDYVYWKIILEP